MSFNQISPGISPRISPSGSPSRINVVQPFQKSPKQAFFDDSSARHGSEIYTLKSFGDGRWKKAFQITFNEFCDCTSIHGIKHFLNHSWIERLLWIVLFIISITGCSLMISLVWQKWNQSPVILSFDNKLMTMASIPFPAVTVCSEAKADVSRMNYREMYEKYVNNDNLTEGDIKHMFLIDTTFCKKLGQNDDRLNMYSEVDIPGDLRSLSVTKKNQIVTCLSGLNAIGGIASEPCDVEEIPTNEGICYTFNLLDSQQMFKDGIVHDYPSHGFFMKEWSPESGYVTFDRSESYPKRSFGAGSTRGVKLTLKNKRANHVNQCSDQMHHGFNVMSSCIHRVLTSSESIFLHSPTDYPWKREYLYKVGMNQQIAIIIKPPAIITSENLKGYSIDKRKCFFNDERELKYFRYYSQSNCELECYAQYSIEKCGCVEYWLPHFPDTHVCTLNITRFKSGCDFGEIDAAIQEERVSTIINSNDGLKCNCLPSCSSIQYEADQTMLLNKIDVPIVDEGVMDYVEVLLYYKGFQFIPMKRTELYTDLDFISNCGGLLSLFIGTSLLSIVEVIYFFTIRLLDNFKRKKNN